jgi:hypothetical protein
MTKYRLDIIAPIMLEMTIEYEELVKWNEVKILPLALLAGKNQWCQPQQIEENLALL